MKDLAGKVAVVTGAASGIGFALASRLAERDMKVVMADVESDALERAAQSLSNHGDRILAIQTDVSSYASVDAMANRVTEQLGPVHLLCNNAGVAVGGLSWTMTLEDWQWILGVNLMGVIHGIKRFVPSMIEHGEPGHVVNTASMAGMFTSPMNGLYAVTKHGVIALSETMYNELVLIGSKVNVSCLCPGWVRTNILDSERNRPEELSHERNVAPGLEAMRESFRQNIEAGMEPTEVADKVIEAVIEDRFWVLPHPEWLGVAEQRFQRILGQENPHFDMAAAVELTRSGS